ncbi:TonB-dependent receptor [Algoriphagus sp. 4150]|uniref:TonB-dependent receptor n=1 Tax=Algoriphagus sp. 4150 TaxID=2817756 RepID=UPI0028667BD3|nr:TonB-dependent receptor [Algoriphagus sp. 4150]MDR7131787.1 TonB-dependent receptor [Algoriphagus sp. 4150]
MQKHLQLMLVLMFLSFAIKAQTNASISGRISDGNGYLPGVNVYVIETNHGAPTDLSGKFDISNLPTGKVAVRISYLGYETVTKVVELVPGKNTIGNIILAEAAGDLEEYVINGTMIPSQMKAMSIKKNSLAIMDVIAADAIGKLPDRNAAEAVQRLPGASVNRYHGEANQVSVRGTPYAWASTLYNGTRLPSANVFGNRNSLLDAIPAEMIQYVQLSKAITPDMEGDAIGGSVNFVTRTAPQDRTLNISLAGGYGQKSQNGSYNASLVYGDRFFDGKLGFVISGSIWNRNFASDEIALDYNLTKENPAERYSVNTMNAKRYYGTRTTSAVNAAIEYEFSSSHKVFARLVRDRFDDVRPVYESYYEFNRNRYRYSNRESEYKTNLKGVELGGSHNLSTTFKLEWKASSYDMYYRLDTPPGMPSDQKGLPIAQFFQNLEGDFGGRSADGLIYNTFDSPDGKGISPLNFDPQLSNENDFLDPTRLSLQQMIIYQIDQRDRDRVGQVDFTWDASSKFSLKAGGKFRFKKNEGMNTPLAFLANASLGIPNSAPLRYLSEFDQMDFPVTGTFFKELNGQFDGLAIQPMTQTQIFELFTPEFFEQNGINNYSSASNATTKFNGTEDVYAGYIMGTYELNSKLKVVGGFRNEYTQIEMNSSVYDAATKEVTPITKDHSYNAFLPMFHVKYSPSENKNLRLAYTRTFARANFADLSPSENIDITGGIPRITRGNTYLLPTFSNNFDVMGEWFLQDIGLLTAGIFYKDIDNFIFRDLSTETIDGTGYLVSQPKNLESAFLVGFEMGITKRFSGLPGFWSGFGVDVNYTLIHSELEVPRIGESGEPIAVDITSLPNQSKNLFNTSLFYEKNGLMLRLAGNYRGPSIETINQNLGPDYYVSVNKNFTVDFSAAYSVSDRIKVFAEVRNLTNEPFVQYLGENKNRITSSEWYATNGQAGIRYVIF